MNPTKNIPGIGLNRLLESIDYKNYTINIYQETEYKVKNNPMAKDSFGFILMNKNKAFKFLNQEESDILHSLPIIPVPEPLSNICICEQDYIDKIKSNDKYVYLDLYGKDLHLDTTHKKDYEKLGVVYGFKNFLEKQKKYSKTNEISLSVFDNYYWAKEILKKEIECFDNFLNHNIFGYEIYNPQNQLDSSCWGFNQSNDSIQDLIKEAKDYIEKVSALRF